MNVEEAKELVSKDFILKYRQWIDDYNCMAERDYAHKYGWGKGEETRKDTQKSLIWFQSHIYSGRYLDKWAELGIDRSMVYQLHREGFFSYDYCTSYKARMLGKTDFYYLSQAKVKEIYKAYK